MNAITTMFLVRLLSPSQLAVIIVLSILLVAFIAGNVWLFIYLRNRGVRKLCTYRLQNRRDDLLKQLNLLKEGIYVSPEQETVEEEEEDAEAADELLLVDEEDDDKDEEEEPLDFLEPHSFEVVTQEEIDETFDAEILYIAQTSAEARAKLGFADAEYDRKRYYVRYTLGFEARLRLSSEEIKERYTALMNEIATYKGVKVKPSYRQQRIYKGRKTLGLIMFRGKTLCIALALNPADYEETKFRGIDKSDSRRFAKTPMLMKLTSNRRLDYAKYLLLQLAEENTIMPEAEPQQVTLELAEKSRDELFVDGKLQITVLGEVPDSVPYEQPEPEEEELDEEEELEGGLSIEELKRYNRSYTARITQADDELKARYSEIKNHIVSYHGVFNGITWKREAFYVSKRDCFATFAIRGKTLCMFLAVPASRFDGTKYKVEDRTQQVRNAKMPTMFRIRSDRGTKYAKELIDIVLAEKGVKVNDEYKPVNYRLAYRSTENLIRSGYIKVKTTQVTVETSQATPDEKQSAAKKKPAVKKQSGTATKKRTANPKKSAAKSTVKKEAAVAEAKNTAENEAAVSDVKEEVGEESPKN